MLASMTMYPEFYQNHMSVCIGFSPCRNLENHDIPLLKIFGKNKTVLKMVEGLCPQILEDAGAFNFIMK
jgi:hypothetical protein